MKTGSPGSGVTDAAARPDVPPGPATPKAPVIKVSPAVLDAAHKEGDELLNSLGTSLNGLTQTEARARAQDRSERSGTRAAKIVALSSAEDHPQPARSPVDDPVDNFLRNR